MAWWSPRAAVGKAVRYESVGPAPDRIGVELPDDQQIPTRRDTIFDVASMSKLFTTIVVLQFVEDDLVDLDAPVARYVPSSPPVARRTSRSGCS